jgi:hypothetical protein
MEAALSNNSEHEVKACMAHCDEDRQKSALGRFPHALVSAAALP